MDLKEIYASKLVSAEQAAAVVKSGDWVDYGWTTGTPVAVDKALAARLPQLENVNFRGGILMWVPEIFKIEDPAAHMTWNSWHMSGIERKAVAQGFSFYSPIRYSELPRYYRESANKPDVAIFQVAPMDEHGYFNFGPNASHMAALCETSKCVIVEVNENMPRCLGGMEESVHVSQVDMIGEGDNPTIAEMGGAAAATEVDQAGAKLIVEQIPNGACLQLGIGGMPNAVGSLIAQSDLKDLGVHTEMYVDAFVDIANAGKITGANKAIDKGRQVYAFGAGTKKLYDYLNNNPACMSARGLHQRRAHHQPAGQLHVHQQRGGPGPVRSGKRRERRCEEHQRCRRPAGLRTGCLPVQGRQELHLLLFHLHGQKDRPAAEPHSPHPGQRLHRDRYPRQHSLSGNRVRPRQSEGPVHLAEGGGHHLRGTPRLP